MKKEILILVLFGLLVTLIVLINRADGSTFTGLPAFLATSSQVTVGPSVVGVSTSNSSGKALLTIPSQSCASRVITTTGKPIMLSFGALSSTTPSGSKGHYQAASTTVAYDSGIYGCGLVTAYGFDSSTTITISEFR